MVNYSLAFFSMFSGEMNIDSIVYSCFVCLQNELIDFALSKDICICTIHKLYTIFFFKIHQIDKLLTLQELEHVLYGAL